MTKTRILDWRSLVVQSDPDFHDESLRPVEYEFSARGIRGQDRTHERGLRVFRGDYQRRGAYTPEVIGPGTLTWNGRAVTWNGGQLLWD